MTEEERTYNTPDFVFGAAAPENPGALMPAKVGFPALEFEVKDLEGTNPPAERVASSGPCGFYDRCNHQPHVRLRNSGVQSTP